jgi:hypothetical protein
MFDFARFLLSSTLFASLSGAAPVDLKQPDDTGKQKPASQEEDKLDKVEPEESAPVVTEHTVTLPGAKTLSYKVPPYPGHETREPNGEGFRQRSEQREAARPTRPIQG